jgi:hypothetical protein
MYVSFQHFAIPPSHHYDDCTIPLFRQPTMWSSHHSATCVNFGIPPFRHSTTPAFCQSNPFKTFNHSDIPTFQHPAISRFSLFRFRFFAISPLGHQNILPFRESDFAN